MAELFALVHVADVNLDDWSLDGLDCIVNCNACVRVGTGIKHNTIGQAAVGMCCAIAQIGLAAKPRLVQPVNDFTLNIALEIFDFDLWKDFSQLVKEFFKCFCSVDARLASPQQIQIWAIDD